ncbi:hypothetical protein JXR01_03160 [Candidatus Kaiserbacteria bacterium]|nr:MAG: hypothetical protein JXR01_03160 [Candidatus Kaiserbacteria bacterium]
MTTSNDEVIKAVDEAASYLKKKVREMEQHKSSGITDARRQADRILDELKKLFSRFEIDLKNRE